LFQKALQFRKGPDGKGEKFGNRIGDRGIQDLAPVTGRQSVTLTAHFFIRQEQWFYSGRAPGTFIHRHEEKKIDAF
jgi:hypothetical protein